MFPDFDWTEPCGHRVPKSRVFCVTVVVDGIFRVAKESQGDCSVFLPVRHDIARRRSNAERHVQPFWERVGDVFLALSRGSFSEKRESSSQSWWSTAMCSNDESCGWCAQAEARHREEEQRCFVAPGN